MAQRAVIAGAIVSSLVLVLAPLALLVMPLSEIVKKLIGALT